MAIDPHRLDGYLDTVTPALAVRLAWAVETDRARGGKLPHDRILMALRPKLREANLRLGRVPTFKRLVCEGFEDLLCDGPRSAKQQGRVPRSSVEPIWTWLTETLAPDAWRAAEEAATAKLVTGGPDFVKPEIAAFQQVAAAAILAAHEDGEAARRALGLPELVADAYDIARMLEIASAVAPLQQELGRPIRGLDADALAAIDGVWRELALSRPEAAPYLVFMVLGRLEKPWEIMRLSGVLSHRIDDALLNKTDAGLAGELLLSDLEACALRLRTMRALEIDFDVIERSVEMFSMISTGIVRELGIKRDGGWGKRIMAARGVIADAMERLLARALKDVLVTLPTMRRATFGFRGRRMPDLTKALDPAKAARAEAFARIVAAARPHAAAGAFVAVLSGVDEKLCRAVKLYTAELIDELLAVSPPLRAQAAGYVEHAATLCAWLISADEADILRRRCAAAIAAWDSETLVA